MRLVKKSESALMKFVSSFLPTPGFMFRYWTTIGDTVYVPTIYDDDPDWGESSWRQKHARILEHERIHVAQWENYTPPLFATIYVGPSVTLGLPAMLVTALGAALWGWMPLLVAFAAFIVLLPLSVGFAIGRLLMELEAFGPEFADAYERGGIEAFDNRVRSRTDQLWTDYLWTMPPSIARGIAYSFMEVEP